MTEYNLNNLGDENFENIIQSLLKKIIGNNTITFGKGADGSREATFEGTATNYPSETEKWSGKWIFQAKYHDNIRLGPDKAREYILQDLRTELNSIVKKYKIDNYILATNVILTPVLQKGTLDKIYNEIIPEYKDKIKNISVWGYDEICAFIDNNEDVRSVYWHYLLTTGDLVNIINKIFDKNKNKLSTSEIQNYLCQIMETRSDVSFSSSSSEQYLRDYYVNHRCVVVPFKYWKATDEYLTQEFNDKITDIFELVNQLLRRKSFILIASNFGIGKTILAKMLTINYATELINFPDLTRKFFPIYVNLSRGLYVEYESFSLKNFLTLLPLNDNTYPLLILDGLDEIIDVQNLHNEIEKLRNEYPKLKIIITSRIQDDIIENHSLLIDEYIRLLPFNEIQFNLFCEKLKIMFSNEILTFQRAKDANFPLEILSTPIFLTMLYDLIKSQTDIFKIISNKWSKEMIKSFIFMLLFHNIIQGKYSRNIDHTKLIQSFRNEKKILRFIAALYVMVYPKPLTLDLFSKYKDMVLQDIQTDLKKLPFINLVNHIDGTLIYLEKKIFFDYLLAEYILEAILEEKIYKLSINLMTAETINFLSGLICLLKETKVNREIEDVLIKYNFSLINSISDVNKYSNIDIIKDIERITIENLKSSHIGWFIQDNKNNNIKLPEQLWCNVNLSDIQIRNLMSYRWILLFVNRKLNPDKYLQDQQIKNNIVEMINIFGNISYYPLMRYFPRIDLSGCNLSGSRLRRANLEGSNLEGTNLESVDLTSATLDNANFQNSNISYADLSHITAKSTNFENIKMNGTVFSNAKLETAIFKNATGSYSELDDVNAQGATFENSLLNNANLRRSNFTNTNFNGTQLNGADLYRANFTNSLLNNIDIKESIFPEFRVGDTTLEVGPTYNLLFCECTKFKDAKFNNEDTVNYLKERGGLFD